MAKGQQRNPAREAMWRARLARHGKSEMSVREFCEQERVPESAFYAWRRTIRQRDAQPSTSRPAFVPLVVQGEQAPADGQVIVELRGGRVLRLPPSMPPAQLAAVVHAIEQTEDPA